jgi:hypothetical protein
MGLSRQEEQKLESHSQREVEVVVWWVTGIQKREGTVASIPNNGILATNSTGTPVGNNNTSEVGREVRRGIAYKIPVTVELTFRASASFSAPAGPILFPHNMIGWVKLGGREGEREVRREGRERGGEGLLTRYQ